MTSVRPAAQDPNAYTDAPSLPRNWLLAVPRLLFWLFFHPRAWRGHLLRLDKELRVDFCLAELPFSLWRRLVFWRFLLQTNLLWPLLQGLLLYLILDSIGLPAETVVLGMMLGVATGLLAALMAALVGSLIVGVTIGLAAGLVLGLGGGLLLNAGGTLLLWGRPYDAQLVIVVLIGLTTGLAGGLSFGVTNGLERSRSEDTAQSLGWQVSGVVLAVMIGWAMGQLVSLINTRVTASALLAVILTAAIWLRTNNGPRAIFSGAVMGLLVAAAGGLPRVGVGQELLQTIVFIGLITTMFALPYAVAARIAGPWAGGLAGALGSGGGLFLYATGRAAVAPFLAFSLVGILLGLTLAWWRPVILYPFLLAWNRLLVLGDERRLTDDAAEPWLRYHSAFWDESQRLPLVGLDSHLLLLDPQHLAHFRAATAYLSTTPQRWAAQAAQIELDARMLARCQDVEAIAAVHPGLAGGDLIGPASALLRSFSRSSADVAAALAQESLFNRRLALNAVEDRLDALLRELTRSNEPYAARFRPIAADWRQIVAAASRQLAAEAERRQEIDSPYIIGVPLTEKQEIFIGRQDISARIEQLLLDRRRPPLLLYGQRRVGKTSLLNNLGRLLPSTIVPLFVDLQGPASRAADEGGFLYNIARGMRRSAQQQRSMILPPLTREMLADDPFTQFESWLDGVEAQLAGQMALLMLDEFEALERVLADGRYQESVILGMLRHIIQHRPQFKVLLSGSHTLSAFHHWSSYLINVQVIHIGVLSPQEARQLIVAPVGDFALRYEDMAIERVLALTQGHPFLVQLLCAEIVAAKNEQPAAQRRLATGADVEAAVPPALQHGTFFFADIWQNQVDDRQKNILLRLAAEGEGGICSTADLAAAENLTMDDCRLLCRQLNEKELLVQTEKGYRFFIEMVRRAILAMG